MTDGAVELVDATGVVRARATADGGAEQLVAECRFARGVVRTRSGQAGVQVDLDDVSIRLRSQRLQRDPGYPNPPVEVKMSLATGAPAAEVRPADGAVRYAVESTAASPTRMVWRRYSYRNTPRSPD